jgi:radical SAM protein (TIGR04043 family)
MSDLSTRVDVAVRGIRSLNVPVTRTSGAGPSDDGHVLIGGIGGAIPIRSDSPYEVSGNRLLLNGTDMGVEIEPVRRPRFYDLDTADGISYEKIARLHGTNVLATTVVQTCIRYDPQQRCRFCSIEASLQSGSTIAVKKPEQLAEVAEAAVRLDGVTQMIMTTGTSAAKDRGARHLARCVAAVKAAAPDLAIQFNL